MARQRFIWPNLWDDPQLGKLTDTERILYICCFSMADDEGRLIGDPAHLRSTAHAFKPRLSLTNVRKQRTNVAEACSQFYVYSITSVEYIQFLNWPEWQKPKYPSPSKLPPPPGYTLVGKRWLPGMEKHDSRKPGGSLPEGSPTGRDGLGSTDLDLLEINPLAVDVAVDNVENVEYPQTNGPESSDEDLELRARLETHFGRTG